MSEKMCTIFGEGLITDWGVGNLFINFRSGNTTFKVKLRMGRPSHFDDILKAIL